LARASLLRIFSRDFWQTVLAYLGRGGGPRVHRIIDLAGLRDFLETRASHVAQTALYGYLRTRAGTRSFELFASDDFAVVMNAAKWNVWLACLSDLAIYAGGLVAGGDHTREEVVGRVMSGIIDDILKGAGMPDGADSHYAGLADALRKRVASCAWSRVQDDETAFSESPAALVHWAPIMPELKQLDEDIVRNSVRFRWQDVRRELRANLDAPALLESAAHSPA
jgi:hypothetical protein